MKHRSIILLTTVIAFSAAAKTILLDLPKPSSQAPATDKPVKVYLLAGQSNMVGMGDIKGLKPPYPSVRLSADPHLVPGVMPLGGAKLAKHGIKNPTAAIFSGAYNAATDYSQAKPQQSAPVALGTVSANLPAIDGPHTVVVTASIDVPTSGTYHIHVGHDDSTHAIASIDGKNVYTKRLGTAPELTKFTLEAGKSYPLAVTYLKGGSCALWLEQIELPFLGDLTSLTKRDGKFSYLIDEKKEWSVRNDVSYFDPRLFPTRASTLLTATSNNGGSIGPELGFGHVLGTFHDEQVLIVKTSMGNRALNFDFRPPSSGRTQPDNEYEALEYKNMVDGLKASLAKIGEMVPGYKGQGYELAGFGWFQGHKDSGSTKAEYEKNLVNLISDLRKEFNAPNMKAVVATVGFDGYNIHKGPWANVWEAQMAVGDPKQHPELVGNVASVDTRDFWRNVDESPREQGFHYNRNAETYLLVGESMGRAMVRLLGGQAEAIPKSDREQKNAAEIAAKAAAPVLTEAQKAAHLVAIRPMILEGNLAAFMNNPTNQKALQAELTHAKPDRAPESLNGTIDEIVNHYSIAGIKDYEWKTFGPDISTATWDYYSVAIPSPEISKIIPVEPLLTYPADIRDWFQPSFDAKKAGWKSGQAPIGESAEGVKMPDYIKINRSPKTITSGDVLLIRQTFDLPKLQAGHRYRVRVSGSAHNNYGEGFCLYVNGRMMNQSNKGVIGWRKMGGAPRGSLVTPDFEADFHSGKVCIAVANFKTKDLNIDKIIPPGEALRISLEEQKLPPGLQ
jgi:alpha-galactosidase